MKGWIVSLLLCAVFALRTVSGAVLMEHEQNSKLPVETKEVEEHVKDLSPKDAANGAIEELAFPERIYCPPGWFNYRSRCFQVVKSAMSWVAAERHCVSLRGSLASVQSPDEEYFLQNLVTASGLSQAWIGAYYFQGTWWWIDRAGFYYSNWLPLNSVNSYPCAYIKSNAGWSNANCASAYNFVCSINPNIC
ncbi:ladderlectin-like [Brachyhypopomus gauderio]|uniref:ladderlectin-like n=1 Tax=Brachyhypopomus gauderio TaxID=698409 RepID=UPI004042308E